MLLKAFQDLQYILGLCHFIFGMFPMKSFLRNSQHHCHQSPMDFLKFGLKLEIDFFWAEISKVRYFLYKNINGSVSPGRGKQSKYGLFLFKLYCDQTNIFCQDFSIVGIYIHLHTKQKQFQAVRDIIGPEQLKHLNKK